jgi:hypothetical protein
MSFFMYNMVFTNLKNDIFAIIIIFSAQEIFQIIVYRVLIQIIEFLQIIDAVVKMDFMKTV